MIINKSAALYIATKLYRYMLNNFSDRLCNLYLLVYWSQDPPLFVCGYYVPLSPKFINTTIVVIRREHLYKQIKSVSMCNIFNNSHIIIIYLFALL